LVFFSTQNFLYFGAQYPYAKRPDSVMTNYRRPDNTVTFISSQSISHP